MRLAQTLDRAVIMLIKHRSMSAIILIEHKPAIAASRRLRDNASAGVLTQLDVDPLQWRACDNALSSQKTKRGGDKGSGGFVHWEIPQSG